MKFCPNPTAPNMGNNEKAIQELIRKIKVQIELENQEDSPEDPSPSSAISKKYKKKSEWNPKTTNKLEIEYLTKLKKELLQATPTDTMKHNLTKEERTAIKTLKSNKTIIVKPADKGSGTVIMTTDAYKIEVYSQLTNPNHYKETTENITAQLRTKIIQEIKHHVLTGAIPPATEKWLILDQPKPARFYILPKTHPADLLCRQIVT